MSEARPRPTTDLDSAPWWEALADHRLVVQRCSGCGRLRWPRRVSCNQCGSHDADDVPASGRATVVSWSVTHHSFGRAMEVPFTVVLARLDDQDDIVMPGQFDGPGDGSGLAIGLPVVAGFRDVEGDDGEPLTLLTWRLPSA